MSLTTSNEPLPLYTIYWNPSDYPNKYVVRKWFLERPGPVIGTTESLDKARALLPDGVNTNLKRFGMDDPVIVETWV